MRVTVVGAGYVGLVTSACLADLGHEVICCDVDSSKIGSLRSGEVTIHEPGLGHLVKAALENGNLLFTETIAAEGSHVVLLAVDTPFDGKRCDIDRLLSAARSAAATLNGPCVFAVKSTAPPGTCDLIEEEVRKVTWQPVEVVSNPEFLREGNAIDDFLEPNRIAIGSSSPDAIAVMTKLYADVRTHACISDRRSVEVSKYASNIMLATRVSLMNELADFCEKVGADIKHVAEIVGRDERIGPRYLHAGVGFGGSCLPKDIECYLAEAYRLDVIGSIVAAVYDRNQIQYIRARNWAFSLVGGDSVDTIKPLRFAIWGLAFKAGTDDVRASPGVALAQELSTAGHEVVVSDIEGMMNGRRSLAGCEVTFEPDRYTAVTGADALLVLTDWGPYRTVNWDRLAGLMRRLNLYDGRNLYDLSQARSAGFSCRGVGRGLPPPPSENRQPENQPATE